MSVEQHTLSHTRIAYALGGLVLLAVVTVALLGFPRNGATLSSGAAAMPQFENQSPDFWINTPPLRREELLGKVVLIEIWTSI